MKDLKQDKRESLLVEKEKYTSNKYKRALKELTAVEQEMEALLRMKKGQNIHSIAPKKSGNESEATVVVCASDWHIEETVKKSKVSGLNEYNLDIARSRSDQLFVKAIKLTRKEQQDVSIKEMVLFLGGDFISGNIHQELLENCSLRPIEAILYAQELLESGIKYILDNSELHLTVICCCGNHSRLTDKTHISTEQGNSLEYFMYRILCQRFESERVHFIIGDGYHIYYQIYGKMFRFHHGHGLRYYGGVGGLTIPANKAIAQWNKAKVAQMDVWGHFHTYMPLSNFVSNGSLIGYNAYAVSIKADFERPQQAMFLVDSARGVTYHFPILF